eukprot:PRCOL_00006633-RA
MAQGLIYAFVARRPSTVLCDHTAYSGNFSVVALQCLEKLPASETCRMTYTCDRHTFNYLCHGGFAFLAVADEDYGRQVPFAFLERVRDDFMANAMAGAGGSAGSHSLQQSFGPQLKRHMQFAADKPEELSKVAMVQKQVSEVKNVMMDNIEKVLDRGEKIELLVDKTENLRTQADAFQRTGRRLRSKMWWQNLKMKLIVALILLTVIFVIFMIACNGFKCTK